MINKKVVVIGGGPAGLAISISLASSKSSTYNYTIHLIEKGKQFDQRGFTFGLAPNGQKALIESCSKSTIEKMNYYGISAPGGVLMLPWFSMRDSLLEVARSFDNIIIYNGLLVKNIIDEKEQEVRVEFENHETIECDFVIGADGVSSITREILKLPNAIKTNTTVFRGRVDALKEGSKLSHLLEKGIVPIGGPMVEGTYICIFNYHSKMPGILTWVVSTRQEIETGKTTPFTLIQSLEETNLELFETLTNVFNESNEEFLQPFPPSKVVDFSNEFLQPLNGRWGGKGRITLIGDAAHAMRPTDGQGGNMAFEDVAVLSRYINKMTETDNDISKVLKEFEEERLVRVKKMHDNQRERYEKRIKGEKVGQWEDEFKKWVYDGI